MELRLWQMLLAVLELCGHHVTHQDHRGVATQRELPVQAPPYPLNKRFTDIINFALGTVRDIIRQNNLYNVGFPNYEAKILSSTLLAVGGEAYNMVTIKRVGEVTTSSKGNDTLYVSAAITMTTLHITYEMYYFSSFKGILKIIIGDNRLRFWVTIQATPDGKESTLTVSNVKMEKFYVSEVRLAGFPVLFNGLAAKIVEFVLNEFSDKICEKLETNMKKEINKLLQKWTL